MNQLSIKNYFEPTPKNVQKWLLALKSIMATIGGAAYFQDPKLAFWVLVGGAVLNEFANLLSNGNNENNESK